MRLADLSSAKRREVVALALDFTLQDLKAPADTFTVAGMIAKRLGTDEARAIGRILVSMAPSLPQADRGASFARYGRIMQRWSWKPKGAGPTPRRAQPADDWSIEPAPACETCGSRVNVTGGLCAACHTIEKEDE